jgi:hypothetical protein
MKPLAQVAAIIEIHIHVYTNHFPSESKQFEVTFPHTLMIISWHTFHMLVVLHSHTFTEEMRYAFKIYVGNSERKLSFGKSE